MALQTGRPPKSGVNAESRNAERFRRAFRKWRDQYGATNREIGATLEAYGLCGKSDGTTCVQNALAPSRKLTHEWARKLVAGLLLSQSARSCDAMADEAPAALLSVLVAIGAMRIKPPTVPAIFMPPSEVASLVAYIDQEATKAKVLGPKMRACLRKAMKAWLQSVAPQMARAWVNAADKAFRMGYSHDRRLLDKLALSSFGDDYLRALGAEQEPELKLLYESRPELVYSTAILSMDKEQS